MLLNAGGELGDARSETERLRARSIVAISIVRSDWIGREAEEVRFLYQRLKDENVVVGVDGNLREIGDIIFEIQAGVVSDVRYID